MIHAYLRDFIWTKLFIFSPYFVYASFAPFFFINVCNGILPKNEIMRDSPPVPEGAGDADLVTGLI